MSENITISKNVEKTTNNTSGYVVNDNNKAMNISDNICMGMLAHVDAGKTTLSEAILYETGTIRKLGRVDTKDAFLDTDSQERDRGITIFSKQAVLELGNHKVTLLDTPGHVDFSAEMERALWVMDYAVLVISAADGVQAHTETLWRLLARRHVPVFIFVNKMDQKGMVRERVLENIKNKLSGSFVDFTPWCLDGANRDDFNEEIAVCDEVLLNRFLEDGNIQDEDIKTLIRDRKMFPVFFGSALKMQGVKELLSGIDKLITPKSYPDEFGARIYKISRDEQGNRLTHMKVTGGILRSKMEVGEEKVNQLRVYSGEKFKAINEAMPGQIVAVTGLENTIVGECLGEDSSVNVPILAPVLTYKLNILDGTDEMQLLPKLKLLEEEEPQLHIEWNEFLKEIQIQVMGPILTEIITNIIKNRFGVDVSFGQGNIVYKETITNKVEGIGHFEPLRHYAEVHLILEPGEAGSGMQFFCDCSEDVLAKNWQRLIYTHMCEKSHRGVLIGAGLTDVKITLKSGRAHNKHTVGGDFRQATYRAIRQGLMQAESQLLEPYYEFELRIPMENVGRAMTDLGNMNGKFELLGDTDGELSLIKGVAPVACLKSYHADVIAYTKGRGSLNCVMAGYMPCHNSAEIIETKGYDPVADIRNTPDSVFCAHGSGFVVPWNEVTDYMHVESVLHPEIKNDYINNTSLLPSKAQGRIVSDEPIGTDEIDAILNATYYANSKSDSSRKKYGKKVDEMARYVHESNKAKSQNSADKVKNKAENQTSYLLVDGYNIIFAWSELSELAKVNLDGARGRLLDILCNYQAMKKCELIAVFDAYRVAGHQEEFLDFHNIHVVYTKEAETADHYIEKFAKENGRKYQVTVATSDGLEQIIIRGSGCLLLSARDFEEEVKSVEQSIRDNYLNKTF